MTLQDQLQRLQQPCFDILDFDTDAGQLLEILGRKNLDYQQKHSKEAGA